MVLTDFLKLHSAKLSPLVTLDQGSRLSAFSSRAYLIATTVPNLYIKTIALQNLDVLRLSRC